MPNRSAISVPLAGELIVCSGPDEGVTRTLLVPITLIGRNESCDLRVLEPGVRSVHCVIAVTPDGAHLRSVGGGTKVNGTILMERLLVSGDVIEIGPIELVLNWRLPPSPTPHSSALVRLASLDEEVDEDDYRREAG